MANKLKCSGDPVCEWVSTAEKSTPKAQQEYTIHFIKEHQNAT